MGFSLTVPGSFGHRELKDYPASVLHYVKHSDRRKENRLRRIRNVSRLPKSYVEKLTWAVGIFEEWMWSRYGLLNEPAAESLNPETLDAYLEEFFATVKRPSGQDYRKGTFEGVRFKIERYLKETGYENSIVSSPLFKRSRLAYRQRLATLP